MPAITSAQITIRGRVNSQVKTLLVDSSAITLHADNTFTHTFPAPVNNVIQITTIDNHGRSETRAMHITTTNQTPAPVMPSAAT